MTAVMMPWLLMIYFAFSICALFHALTYRKEPLLRGY